MFKRFTGILNSAVEALAPNQPLLDDFVFHWKAVTNFFMENRDAKSPIEETNIPTHLQNMLDILIHEENQDDSGSTGPCMEYLLHHKLLETLYTIGRADCPAGMKQKVLHFYKDLLSKIKQPLLPHINVFKAVHKLIRICGEIKASPTEVEEMQFLCTVCAKLKEHPHVVNFFLEDRTRDAGVHPRSVEEARANTKQTGSDADQLEFGLVDALLSMSHSADSRVAMKCCEGLILIVSIPEDAAAKAVINNTKFLHEITSWLNTAYTNLPRNVNPDHVELVNARWGIDYVSSKEITFPGHRHVVNFLSLFDYCNILVNEAHPLISEQLCVSIRRNFLEPAMKPDMLKDSDAHFLSATAYLTKAMDYIGKNGLVQEISRFVFEVEVEESQRTLAKTLIERCDDPAEEVCSLHLQLFDAILRRPTELAVYELLGKYLLGRGYYDESKSDILENTEAPSPAPMTPEEENEYSSLFEVEKKEPAVPINKIVNYYLDLLPEDIKSSFQLQDTGYEVYINDAHRMFADVNLVCSSWEWKRPKDYLSAPESQTQNGTDFFEGPFLRIIFGRIAQMTEQSYSTNLVLTSIISKLALLPHPYIHEYLLNPFIPLKDGVTNLCTAFRELMDLVTVHSKNCVRIRNKLINKRNTLYGIFGGDAKDITADEDRFLGAIIIFEEFCKELSAISFAKHHILF